MDAPSLAVLDYQLSAEELASFMGEGFARARLYKLLWPHRWFTAGLVFLALVFVAMIVFSDSPWWTDARARLVISATFGLLILLLTVVDPIFSTLVARRHIRSGLYSVHLRRIRIEIAAARLRVVDHASGTSHDWDSIRAIKRSKLGAVIYLPPSSALLIPRRAFESEAAFVEFLTSASKLPHRKI